MSTTPTDTERPFRTCPACGKRTPTNVPRCVECGEPSVQAMADEMERESEQRFARTYFMRGTPATWALIGANVAVFILMIFVAKTVDSNSIEYLVALANFGAKLSPLIQQGQYWRFVNPIFIHIGALHLIVNMYSLYAIGPQVERLYGTARFLILYLLSGVAGVVASYYLSDSPGPSAGASGALFGLLGVLFIFGVRYRSELPGMFKQAFSPRGLVPVLVLNLFITFQLSFIDKWAHLGGLFMGGALAAVIPYFRSSERRASVVWRVTAALCVAATLVCFALALRAPKLDRAAVEAMLVAIDATGINHEFIDPYNDSNRTLSDLGQALVKALDKQAVDVAVANKAREVAGTTRQAKGVDDRTRALFVRTADLLDQGAGMLEDRSKLTLDAVKAFTDDRQRLQQDWKGWLADEGKNYGIESRDDNDD